MWYSGQSNSRWGIGYAQSIDGYNWQKSADNPILVADNSVVGETDVADPFVLKEGDSYKMWYTSMNSYSGSGNEIYRINYATSTDNKNWTKQAVPVLRAVANTWES